MSRNWVVNLKDLENLFTNLDSPHISTVYFLGCLQRFWCMCMGSVTLWNLVGAVTQWQCCNLFVALIVWFTTNGMCVKNNTIIDVARTCNKKRDCDAWSLLLFAATVWNFAHMPLGIADRNKMVLCPGCGGRAEFSLHTKNVRSGWFVVKTRGCRCNLSGGVGLIVWFTTNGMCAKNETIVCVARASNSKRDCGAWSQLLFAAVRSFTHMPLGFPTATAWIENEATRLEWYFIWELIKVCHWIEREPGNQFLLVSHLLVWLPVQGLVVCRVTAGGCDHGGCLTAQPKLS